MIAIDATSAAHFVFLDIEDIAEAIVNEGLSKTVLAAFIETILDKDVNGYDIRNDIVTEALRGPRRRGYIRYLCDLDPDMVWGVWHGECGEEPPGYVQEEDITTEPEPEPEPEVGGPPLE